MRNLINTGIYFEKMEKFIAECRYDKSHLYDFQTIETKKSVLLRNGY